MWCMQILGRKKCSGGHPFLQLNLPLFSGFRARFWTFWGGKRTHLWSISAKALSEWYKHLVYITCDVRANMWTTKLVCRLSFFLPNVPAFSGVIAGFWAFGVVIRLVCRVSVPGHFLNDTNIFYIFHVIYAITWKTTFKWLSSFFIVKCTSVFSSFKGKSWAFWGDKRTCSWNINTKALPEW